MLQRFQYGTIVECVAGEYIRNNDIYILDPASRKIRKPICSDEWLTCKLVYVYDESYGYCDTIPNGEFCRCWIVHLII